MKEKTDQILKQFVNRISKLGNIGSATKEKFENYVKDVFEILPLIEKAGFKSSRINVGISIPPSIRLHFVRFKKLSDNEIKLIMNEFNDKKTFKLILKALLSANEFQSKVNSTQFAIAETCIEISIPPKVSIEYINKDYIEFSNALIALD